MHPVKFFDVVVFVEELLEGLHKIEIARKTLRDGPVVIHELNQVWTNLEQNEFKMVCF